jgi:hypothetical protein
VKCKICSRSYRTGGGLVYVMSDGLLTRVRACMACAARAISFVPAATVCVSCGAGAVLCEACARKRFTKRSKKVPAGTRKFSFEDEK